MLKFSNYLLTILLFTSSIINADTLNRQVISASGGNVNIGNENLIYTFGQPFILSTPSLQTGFLLPLNSETISSSCDTSQEEWTCIEFQNLQPSYNIGDQIQIDVNINVKVKRFERVDLWIAVEFPNGSLLFKTDLLSNSFVLNPQPFKNSLEIFQINHHLVDLELTPGLGGIFTFYALYVNEGTNPLEEDISIIKRSEFIIEQTTLANE